MIAAAFAACRFAAALAADPAPLPRAPAPPSIRDFARFPKFDEVKLSPRGDYLAVTARIDTRTVLAILRVSDQKITASVGGTDYQHVVGFEWVSPERVIYSIAENHSALDQPFLTGELFGVNADGSGAKYLFGYRGEMQTGTRLNIAHAEHASAALIDPRVDHPGTALIAVYPWSSEREPVGSKVNQIDIRSGVTAPVVSAPGRGPTQFVADADGFVRYAFGYDHAAMAPDGYVRTPSGPGWKPLGFSVSAGVAYDDASKTGYLIGNDASDRSCLLAHHEDDRREALACHPVASVDGYVLSHDDKVPLRVDFEPGKVESVLLNPDHPDSAVVAKLAKSFPGQVVDITSWSRDGKRAILHVSSDRNPGDYYLFDRVAKNADYLFSARDWIDPEQMGERRPVEFKARDGLTIHGYLTLPRNAKAEKLPMVVLPHGGPFLIRDDWHFNEEAQLLASRGYAVLQVNFRGSKGYGSGFVEAGAGQWATGMIDDIAAGARQVIADGIADGARVCVYGASYGGFAALTSAERYPELYRCAIGYAGVYDLPALKHDSDIAESSLGRQYMDGWIGVNPAQLIDQSPINHLDALKAAVMLVHGGDDRRAPYAQAERLKAALEARKVSVEWLSYATEGHGFYDEGHREAFYEKLLTFLDRNIGDGAAPR